MTTKCYYLQYIRNTQRQVVVVRADADAAVRQAALTLGAKATTEALIKKALA